MNTYILICVDKPNTLDLRMATREAHLAYVRGFADRMPLGGPILDEGGAMTGSVMFLRAESLEAAQAFSADDPYRKAGLFQSVEIHPFRATIGALG